MAGGSSKKLTELCDAVKNHEESDEAVKNQLLGQLTQWDQTAGFRLQKSNKESIGLLLELFLLKDKSVSKQINQVLNDCISLEDKSWSAPQEIFDIESIAMIREKLMPCLLEMLEETKSKDVLKYWSTVVKLLGKHLHIGAELINKVMKVVEKSFKIPETIEESFKTWTVLMDNFALETRILTSAKRVNLLLMPLVQRNVTSESGVRVKFEAWWHFMVLLGPNLHHHVESVVLPFLRFCYGQSEASVKTEGREGKQSPGTPSSPAKKHSALEKLCLDAVLQLVAPRPLDPALPRPTLAPLPAPALLPLQVAGHSEEILYAVVEATRQVKPANKSDVLRVEHIWAGVAALLAGVKEPLSHGAGFQQFLAAARMCVVQLRRTERLCQLLVSLINSAARLPVKILTSSVILSTKEKPHSMLLDLLLYSDFLEGCHKHGDTATVTLYCDTFSRLLGAALHPGSDISALAPVLDKLELAVANLSVSGLGVANTLWRLVADTAAGLARVTDQGPGPGAVPSFGTVLAMLRFPVQCLQHKGGEAATLAAWEQLYRAAVEQGEVSIHHTTGHIVAEVADRLETVLRSRSSSCQLLLNARVARVMVESVDWASTARTLKAGAGGQHPLAGFERMMNPLGNVTSLITHLKHLTEMIVTKDKEQADAAVAKELLTSYRKLFSLTQQDLIRPLLRTSTSAAFAKLLQEDVIVSLTALDASVLPLLESVFATLCVLVKVKYNKEYSAEFLAEIEEVMVASLGSTRSSIRKPANEMWKVTFASLPKEKLSEKLVAVLKGSTSSGVKAGLSSSSEEVSFPESGDGSLSQQVTAEPGIMVGLRRLEDRDQVPLVSSPGPAAAKQQPAAAARSSKRKSLCLRLEDEDSALFVPIKTTPKGKRVLTDHQKDVLTSRHDDIPALYSELSRDDSMVMLPDQFSSQDSTEESRQSGNADSQSLLKSMKSRKNQRFEIPENSRSVRRGRSKEGQKSTEDTDIPVSQDMFSDGSNNEEFKKPAEAPEIIESIESENDQDDSSQSSMINSSVDDIIESSQDTTMEKGVKPRRSRRKTLEKDQVTVNPPEKVAEEKSESIDDKRNKWGETCLFVAVKKGEVEKVKDLLGQGANHEIPNYTGFCPLHEAAVSAKNEAVEIMKLLISSGANVDILSSTGVTPLHESLVYGSKEQVRTLLQSGASVELKTKDGKTSMDLAESSDTEGMLEVLRDERKEYVEQNEKSHVQTETAREVVKESEVKDDKPVNGGNINDDETKVEAMECEPIPSVTEESSNDKKETETEATVAASSVMEEEEPAATINPDCNKENVNSEESAEGDTSKPPAPKVKEIPPKPKSPFTSVNAKQKKPLTPGSRGAMMLNLSRRVSLDMPPRDARDAEAAGRSVTVAQVTVSPGPGTAQLRPWAKYAPSPSHASPSAGILKRSADDLDSSSDGSPVCAKRRRVHFNDNPVSESVEIPRTPKQQYTRKKLQMAALADTADDKEEEMEGVTSLVMCPDLVDSKDNVSCVLHNLATGQFSRILEQDLKRASIATVGQLAALDARTVGQLRGVKPPKVQTVKAALASYHNKVKKEPENLFRKGTPVQEETSQEEEERIKAEFFSRPSPSPTDMADLDNIAEDAEEEESKTNVEPSVHEGKKEENVEADDQPSTTDKGEKVPEGDEQETISKEGEISKEITTETVKKILVEESPEEDVKEHDLETTDAVTTVPDTESLDEIEESCPKDEEDDNDVQEVAPGSSIDKVVVQEEEKTSNVDEEETTSDQKVEIGTKSSNETNDVAAKVDPIDENITVPENVTADVDRSETIPSKEINAMEEDIPSSEVQDNLEAQKIVEEESKESHENVDYKASGENRLEKLMAAIQRPDDLATVSTQDLIRFHQTLMQKADSVTKILFERLQ